MRPLPAAKAKATTPEIPFESVNFAKMPAGLYMGEAVGVATNSKGQVFVFVRSGESRLFQFDFLGGLFFLRRGCLRAELLHFVGGFLQFLCGA